MNDDFCFRLGTDFCIANRANTLKSSIANIKIGYKNKNYKNGETASYEKLTGSKLQYLVMVSLEIVICSTSSSLFSFHRS